jgi:hypothetical protein
MTRAEIILVLFCFALLMVLAFVVCPWIGAIAMCPPILSRWCSAMADPIHPSDADRRDGRGRLSSIDTLPEECDEDIAWANAELRERKMPQTEILRQFNARLADRGVKGISKGAFSRYSVRIAIETRKIEASRQITNEVLARLAPGERSDSMIAAVELLKHRIIEMVMGEDEPDPKALGQATLALQRLRPRWRVPANCSGAIGRSSARRKRARRRLRSWPRPRPRRPTQRPRSLPRRACRQSVPARSQRCAGVVGMTLVRLDFACNDPDNGLFDGQCAGIQLPDLDLELSSNNMRGSSFRVFVGSIKISRRVFRLSAAKTGTGIGAGMPIGLNWRLPSIC